MKNLIKVLPFFGILLFFGCTQVIYTHDQVMDRYKTKQEVTKRFGEPTEKKITDTTEQWLYKFQGRHIADEYPNTGAVNVHEFSKYKKYIIFSFDKQGNVVRWDCVGVSFDEKGKYVLGTILASFFGLILAFGIVVGYLYAHG